MIKKAIALVILVVFTILLMVSYKYLTIQKGFNIYFMEKSHGTFDEVYYNVTDWKFTDYAKHPKISTFLLKKKMIDTK